MRELSEQVLLSRPVFIREVGLPPCVRVDLQPADRHFRTERMSPASVLLQFLERSVWLWPAAGYMLHLLLDLLIMTTLANPVATLVTNYTSVTWVVSFSTL